ncbi:MAG: ATP-binding protein [Candidatus Protistobacter heckmanni]|nr:ATP-binding protein [Candidatus Protistobacter heckmanni]
MLCNLLENAAKYCPPGSHIELSAQTMDAELLVSVADDGPGFPAGMEQGLFDKFVRGGTESAIPGAGLGLAICKSIVLAHGGRIWARRGEAGGARFSFSLPLGKPPEIDLAKLGGQPRP